MIEVTAKKFKALYNNHTLQEVADRLNVSISTVKKYAKQIGLQKGKGNRTNHKRAFSF